jgi:hypothetical protein
MGHIMPGGVLAMGINQQIRVNGDHAPRPP